MKPGNANLPTAGGALNDAIQENGVPGTPALPDPTLHSNVPDLRSNLSNDLSPLCTTPVRKFYVEFRSVGVYITFVSWVLFSSAEKSGTPGALLMTPLKTCVYRKFGLKSVKAAQSYG